MKINWLKTDFVYIQEDLDNFQVRALMDEIGGTSSFFSLEIELKSRAQGKTTMKKRNTTETERE